MSGAMPGEIAGAAGGAGGGKGGGGKGGGGTGGGSPMDWSNTGTGMLNNLDPATMGAGTTAALTGDPTGSLGATAAAVAGGPPTGDMAFQGPPQGTTPAPSPPTPNVQPSLPPIGAPIPDSAFAGPPPFTPGGTTSSRGPIATPGGGPPPTAGAAPTGAVGGGYGPMGPAGGNLSPTLAQIVGGYGGGSPTQQATNVVPFPRAQPAPELGWDVPQPFAPPTAGAAPTGDVGGGIRGVPSDVDTSTIEPPTAGAAATGDVGGGYGPQGADVGPLAGQGFGGGSPTQMADQPVPTGGYGGGSPTQTEEGPGPTQPSDAASTQPTFARQPGQLGPRGVGYGGGPQPGAEPAPATADIPPAPSPPKLGGTSTGPAQAAPGTRAGGQPAAGGAAGQAAAGFNPLKLFGDFLTMALTGNPYPLMSDLGSLASQAAGQPPGGYPGAPPAGAGYGGGARPAGTPPTGTGAAAPGVRAGAPQGAASQLPGAPNGPDPKPDDELGQRRKQWYAQNPNKGTFPEDVPEYQGPNLPAEQQAANVAAQGGEDLTAATKASGVSANYFSDGKAAKAGINIQPGSAQAHDTPIHTRDGRTAYVNKYAAPHFQALIDDLESRGYKINDLGGFANRAKNIRGGGASGPSEHAYGNAIDINPGPNAQGTGRGNMPADIEAIAARHGLTWGGSWSPKYNDPMHFEWTGVQGGQGAQAAQGGQTGAQIAGLDQRAYAQQVGQIESNGNANAPANRGGNRGLYQFGPEEERRYGITNWRDVNQQNRALQLETAENTQILRNTLGRDPTPAELYFVHQQGQTGGPAMLRAAEQNPDQAAWEVISGINGGNDARALSSIRGNIPSDNPLARIPAYRVTAGQFVQMWQQRFMRGYGGAGPQASAADFLAGQGFQMVG